MTAKRLGEVDSDDGSSVHAYQASTNFLDYNAVHRLTLTLFGDGTDNAGQSFLHVIVRHGTGAFTVDVGDEVSPTSCQLVGELTPTS